MHQNQDNKRTYNTSGKSVVVVVKTKSQEMNTFRVKTVDMPGKCILKMSPERVKFKSHATVQISLHCRQIIQKLECAQEGQSYSNPTQNQTSHPPGALTK